MTFLEPLIFYSYEEFFREISFLRKVYCPSIFFNVRAFQIACPPKSLLK